MTHLTLEQCRALKDAGFPQGTVFSRYEDETEGISQMIVHVEELDDDYGSHPNLFACPVADELLEALGEYTHTLCLSMGGAVEENGFEDRWMAECYEADMEALRFQDTPASALCSLWLAVKGGK